MINELKENNRRSNKVTGFSVLYQDSAVTHDGQTKIKGRLRMDKGDVAKAVLDRMWENEK